MTSFGFPNLSYSFAPGVGNILRITNILGHTSPLAGWTAFQTLAVRCLG